MKNFLKVTWVIVLLWAMAFCFRMVDQDHGCGGSNMIDWLIHNHRSECRY